MRKKDSIKLAALHFKRIYLENNEVEIRWQKLMNELKDSSFEPVEYEEVFQMD